MLGSLAPGDDPFVARNDGAWRGGALVYVPRGKRLEAPAQIAAVQDADGAAVSFRTLIVLEEGADVCDYPLARNLIQFAVALAGEAVVRFVLEGQQEDYSFTLRDLRINKEN